MTIPARIPRSDADRGVAASLLGARAAAIAIVFAFFFAISWRPFYALFGTVSFFVVFAGISRAKFEFIREPLVFTDIALVLLLFRHKEMFYATKLNIVFWLLAFGYVFGFSTAFFVFQPSVLPEAGASLAIVTMVAAAATPWIVLGSAPARRALGPIAARLLTGDATRDTRRLGTFTFVALHFAAWLAEPPRDAAARSVEHRALISALFSPAENSPAPIVVVFQSESFLDMRRLGVASLALPAFDALKARAAQWGLIEGTFEGGYTLRTEFSVIGGVGPEALGTDASYPYLRASRHAGAAWPRLLGEAGWRTRFLHPYDRTFFHRHRAMPALGFGEMSMQDAFDHDPATDGPYLSDARLTEAVLEACRATPPEEGLFLFAASMENHGPWQPGRAGVAKEPLDIYLAILERSDRALSGLAEGLDALERPVWLLFYGDHAPLLKSFADPFPDPRPDYLIVPLGRAAAARAEHPGARRPSDLLRDLLGHAGRARPVGPADDRLGPAS